MVTENSSMPKKNPLKSILLVAGLISFIASVITIYVFADSLDLRNRIGKTSFEIANQFDLDFRRCRVADTISCALDIRLVKTNNATLRIERATLLRGDDHRQFRLLMVDDQESYLYPPDDPLEISLSDHRAKRVVLHFARQSSAEKPVPKVLEFKGAVVGGQGADFTVTF